MTNAAGGLRHVAIALAALFGVALSAPSPAAAGPESDIPGVPLPGTVVMGRLGGPIYDIVYRLDVPPGNVVIATLSGSAGTDFDMYLFDPTATTIFAETGLVQKSIGPVSTEAISYAARVPGPYYLDLHGATDVEGDYRLTVQIVPDQTPPTARVLINGDAPRTNSRTVAVSVIGFEDLSGIDAFTLSSDGFSFGPWQPYPSTVSWDLAPQDGAQRVWAKVRNGVGVESPIASSSIMLDTRQPRVASVSPVLNASVATLRPAIRVTFDEPMQASSWMTAGLLLQAADGSAVAGTLGFDPLTRTGTYLPGADLKPGLIYFATVLGARDLAGNDVERTGSWWLKPLIPTTASISISPLVVTYGGSVGVTAQVGSPSPQPLELQIKRPGATAFEPVLGAGAPLGQGSWTFAPPSTGAYRAFLPETATTAAAASKTFALSVRRFIALRGTGPSIIRTAKAGTPTTIRAVSRPEVAGLSVSFRLYRWDASRGSWAYAGSRGARTNDAGEAVIAWTPAAGRWAWRASAAGTADLLANVSPLYRWNVSR